MLVGCFIAVNEMNGLFEGMASLVNTLLKKFFGTLHRKGAS